MAGIDRYKKKYLDALEEQEKLEKKYMAQSELLKKALLNLCVAAKGQENKLDASLVSLQNSLRGGKGSAVFDNVERLERVVYEFDSERSKAFLSTAQTFSHFIDNLLSLSIPADLSQKLSTCRRQLKKQTNSYRTFGETLSVLHQFQQQALDAAADPNMPLWQRLKKGRSLIGQAHNTQFDSEDNKSINGEVIHSDKPAEAQSDIQLPPEQAIKGNIESEPDAISDENALIIKPETSENLPAETELMPFTSVDAQDTYPKVAKRINKTLKNLVDSIDPTDSVKRKIEIVLGRIGRGMDWYALAVTLEDIRDILMARYLNADEEFSFYLKNLNTELSTISEALGIVEQKGEQQASNFKAFSDTVSTQVEQMQKSLDTNETLNGLQGAVNSHIKEIRAALSSFKSNNQEQEKEQSLSGQLKQLLDRVKSVEEESEKSRQQLEEQRYKATHDPLTELPNREAYNERAFHELHRFKRYAHPLTIAICDIDFFKKINDNFGHQTGDKVLKLIAQLISTRLREVDFVARYGGEEFVLLMPETKAEDARGVLDKIRMAIGKASFRFKDKPLTITVSFGIKQFEQNDSVESAFEKADQALYDAKNAGRNQCIIAK